MKRIKFLYICLQSILLLSAANWTHTAVGNATTSTRPVICADPMGYLHVAWTSGSNTGEELQYATNQSGGWNYQYHVAGNASSSAYVPTITCDEYGFAAISARYDVQEVYVYNNIDRTSVSWQKSAGMGYGHYHESSVEIDSNGDIHLFAQEDNSGSYVYYQTLAPENRIDNTLTSQFFATAIDPDDTLHFFGSHDGNIWHSKYNGSNWSALDSIDQSHASAGHPAATCDKNGNLHVVYYAPSGIYYINNTSGSWSTPSQVTTGGIFPDVAIDENGKAHVVYYTQVENGGLFYHNNISGTWSAAEYIATINTDLSPETDDVAHVESKIALDLKNSTVNIVYGISGDSIKVASTGDYELRASVSNDITSTCTTLASSIVTDTLATNFTDTLDLLTFSIKDLPGDGLATYIEQIIFQRGPAMSTDICFNDVFGTLQVECSDGSTTACTSYASKIFVGTKDATWKSVPSNDSLNFTLRGVLKSPISGVNEKKLQFKINGLNDVLVASSGSQMSRSSTSTVSDTILMNELYSHYDFGNLGNDFAGQPLINGMFLFLTAINNEGGIASDLNEAVTLSAVQLDGTTPASSSLASTEGLTKILSNGLTYWMNLTYPTAGEQFRIKASSASLTSVSDTLTSMPYRSTLLITKDAEIMSCLDKLGIQYDHFHEDNNVFPTVSQLLNYDNLLLFTNSGFVSYVDSSKIRSFVEGGNASERNNAMILGYYSLGNAMNSPLARDLFAGISGSGFSQSGDGLSGISQDPITNGLSLSISTGVLLPLTLTVSDSNYSILTENGTGNCVGVKRRAGSYRTILMSPNFWDLTDNADRDSLISKSLSWLTGSGTETPTPISLNNFTVTQKGGNIELKWITESETNNSAFLIYRNDKLLAQIDGAGTSSETHEYIFIDDVVIPGKTYTYVLADVDFANRKTRYGNLAVTITVPNVLTEKGFVVGNAYPNPFNPKVSISYQLSADSQINAGIYNLQGVLVEKLIDGFVEYGTYNLTWDASDMPSGVYIIRLQAGEFLRTQKVILLK